MGNDSTMTRRTIDAEKPKAARSKGRRSAPDAAGGRPPIDLGSIDDIQVLDEQGRINDALDPGLPDDELLRIHRAMVLTRRFDVRMLTMQRQGEMGTFAPSYGQEATQIGQVYPLAQRDWYSCSYRSFGAQIWRGWTLDGLMQLWAGYFKGFEIPEGVNDLPFSIVIGSHVPLIAGIAMGMRIRGTDEVALVNYGDGAASQGVVSEALNFAAVYKAPAIFVCENNGYAISMKACNQTATSDIARRGVAFGIPSIRVDGNDVLGMIVATQAAVARGRLGEGPSMIEAVTYRMGVHTTADDPKVYRDDAEVEAWKAKCPILRFERYLKNRKLLDDDAIERINAECEQQVLDARAKFREEAKADPREVFDYMYDEMPPELARQRDEYLAKLDRKGIDP